MILAKIAKNKCRQGLAGMVEIWQDWKIMKLKFLLFERIEINYKFRRTKVLTLWLRKLRIFHLKKTFMHRGLHTLSQMVEKRRSATYF